MVTKRRIFTAGLFISITLLAWSYPIQASPFRLHLGYSRFEGLVVCRFLRHPPDWVSDGGPNLVIPDFVIAEIPLGKRYALELETGFVIPKVVLGGGFVDRIGVKKNVDHPLLSGVTLSLCLFHKNPLVGSSLELKLDVGPSCSYRLVGPGLGWLHSIQPEVRLGSRISHRDEHGEQGLQVNDYVHISANIFGKKGKVGIGIGGLMVFTTGNRAMPFFPFFVPSVRIIFNRQ